MAVTIIIPCGNDVDIDFAAEVPLDPPGIAGWTIRFQIRLKETSAAAEVSKLTGGGGVTILDAAAGTFRATVNSADTKDLPLGDHYFVTERVDPGFHRKLDDGVCRIDPPPFIA